MHPSDVLEFWFNELRPQQWWQTNDELDADIGERFGIIHQQARACELSHWRQNADGRLAEIIVLDQFSRNLYRDDPRSYACDAQSLVLAQEAVAIGANQQLPSERRAFLYMPFMHSESLFIHEQAVQLFSEPGLESNLEFEQKHKAIIERFGRYPHRNKVLGRFSTQEEEQFLLEPGSRF